MAILNRFWIRRFGAIALVTRDTSTAVSESSGSCPGRPRLGAGLGRWYAPTRATLKLGVVGER